MSAYLVSAEHIDAIVTAAAEPQWGSDWTYYHGESHHSVSWRTANQTGRMLWEECQRSVSARYPDDGDGEWPGPNGLTLADIRAYTFRPRNGFDPVAVLKLIDCYEYQSCEHDGWATSEANSLCRALRGRLIGQLPGYGDAPWGI